MSERLSLLAVQRVACPCTNIAEEATDGSSDGSGVDSRLFCHLNSLSDILTLVGSISPLYYSDLSSLPALPLSSCSSQSGLLPALVRTCLQFTSYFSFSSSPSAASTFHRSSSSSNSPDLSTSLSFSASCRRSLAFNEVRVCKCVDMSHRILLQSLSLLLHRPPADVSEVIDLISEPLMENKVSRRATLERPSALVDLKG
eukprot:GHVS01104700.1.p1 GENE.GHVS01104700.1~~GHVS01104700.1.p1  ORF type:complete len:224 (-),score=28.17 GHVS01104700.1:43-642(-)